jgi:hypothetical protein
MSGSRQSSCSRRRARVSVISVMSLIGSPSSLAKTIGERPGLPMASSAASPSGTMKTSARLRESFICSGGQRQILASKSIWSKRMRRAAPEREAVRANEPEAARSGRLNRPEDSHELGHSPEVEGGVMVAAALREVSHGFEEIGRDWVWEMDAAMRHLDHGVGEEGVKRRLRFPGRSRRQGPQYHCDVERSDALDRTRMEARRLRAARVCAHRRSWRSCMAGRPWRDRGRPLGQR